MNSTFHLRLDKCIGWFQGGCQVVVCWKSLLEWKAARRRCRDVSLKDTPFVALTLHLDGILWTADEELKAGLRAKNFDRFFEP